MSFSLNSQTNKKKFYTTSFNENYFFQLSPEAIFETALLKDVHASLLIQTSSFRSYAASYNYNRGFQLNDRNRLDYRRLIEIYMATVRLF